MKKRPIVFVGALIVLPIAWYLGSPLFIDTVVEEEFSVVTQETTSDAPRVDTKPRPLVEGSFRDADSFHQGSGTATIYEFPDSSQVLRFDDFSVTNGPSLSVYLVKSEDGDIDSGYLDLGKLKGNKGGQNYEIPEGTNLDDYKSVIVWCVPFKVLFTVAPLS